MTPYNNLPEECLVTREHAEAHMRVARSAAAARDWEQARHDYEIALAIFNQLVGDK